MKMNTDGLQDTRQMDLAQELRMTHKLEKIALTLLCVGAASTLLTAFTTLNALAAHPGAAPVPATGNTRPAPVAPMVAAPLSLTGKLESVKAADTMDMNSELTFHFAGSGPCKVSLNSGDGAVTDFTGGLPFTATHFYSSASMTSFDAFKDYTASITASGNCKLSGAGPFTAKVRVVNPHPQSAGAPPKDNTMVLAGNGKINIGVKPGAVDTPVVPATIASLNFPGGASAMAGSATVLTVNGTGNCKYHLSYVNLDAQGNTIMKAYPMLPKSSSAQTPFPMTMTLMPTTPAGVYKWTASGFDGCSGSAYAVLTVQ